MLPTRNVQCRKLNPTPPLPMRKSCSVPAFPDLPTAFPVFASVPSHMGVQGLFTVHQHRDESTQWHSRQHQPPCRRQREELLLKSGSADPRFSSCQVAPSQHFTSPGTAKGHRISLGLLSQMLSPSDRGGEVSYPLEGSAPLLQEYSP